MKAAAETLVTKNSLATVILVEASDVAGYRSTYCANVHAHWTALVTFLGWSQTYELLVQYEVVEYLERAGQEEWNIYE